MIDESAIRVEVGDMIERYGLRVAAGPAIREHANPINRHREQPEITEAIVRHTRALAGMVRAGIPAESDWPHILQL